MLGDNALKFYRDQAYDIPQKPIENAQYIISETVRDRAKRSQFSNPVGLLPTK